MHSQIALFMAGSLFIAYGCTTPKQISNSMPTQASAIHALARSVHPAARSGLTKPSKPQSDSAQGGTMIKLHITLSCLLLTLMTACSSLNANHQPAVTKSNPTLQAGKSTPQLTQYTNSGTTCFRKADKPTDITGFAETICLSFCASHITDTSLVIVVDSSKRTIKLDTRFVEESEPDKLVQPCLTACQYGRADFAIRDLEDGTYTVWLGDKVIGELNIPLESSTCMVSQ